MAFELNKCSLCSLLHEGDIWHLKCAVLGYSIYTASFFLYISVMLNVVTHLIPSFHCGLCSSTVSPMRSISRAKITELPKWQDYGFYHYCHGNMSWEHELPVWYCTLSSSSLLLRGWAFRPLCSVENREGGGWKPRFVCKPVGDIIWQWQVARFSKWADSNLKTWS